MKRIAIIKIIKKFFTNLIRLLYLTIITPDPCKRCVVRAMCSEACDQRNKYVDIFGTMPHFKRLNAYAIILGFTAIIWSGLTIIFK